MRRGWLVIGTLVLIIGCGGNSASAARAKQNLQPDIVAFSASPRHLGAPGGWVTLRVRVQNAVRCTFLSQRIAFSSLYPAATYSCASGSTRLLLEQRSNPYHKPVSLTFGVRAISADGLSVVKTASVLQAGLPGGAGAVQAPKPVPPVVNLDACRSGPHCFYGPIYDTYSDYGNTAPTDLGDCTFAAVADWEQIVLGLHADPTLIGYQFGEAGGTADAGLSAGALVSYWLQSGINNVPLVGVHAIAADQASIENAVRTYTALLVGFNFNDGDSFAQYTMTAGGHMAVVDGFTPSGPLVVSWGKTLQITWAEWYADVTFVWAVGTSPQAVAGPGLTLTPPSPSASYQVRQCWAQYTGNAWSNANSTSETTSFSGNDILTRGPENFWGIVSLSGPPMSTISGVHVLLIEPSGRTFYDELLPDWATTFEQWSVNFHWTFTTGALFFELPIFTGQGTWAFEWKFPDGQTCLSTFTVN